MSYQTIFNIQQSMNVNSRRIVGQQVSRSGQVRVAQYLTSVPWKFTVTPHNYLYYPQVRSIIQAIDNKDRQLPEIISFNNSNLSWFTTYQGDATFSAASAMTLNAVPAANSQTIQVGNLPLIANTKYVFKAGDFLQLGDYPYKVKENVLRGTGTTVEVQLHRPVIGTPSTGTLTAVGQDCTFKLLASECPTYTLNPMADGAFVQWDGAFVFIEDIT